MLREMRIMLWPFLQLIITEVLAMLPFNVLHTRGGVLRIENGGGGGLILRKVSIFLLQNSHFKKIYTEHFEQVSL